MKRLYLIALFIIVSLTATAQENGNRDAQNRIVRGPYETNRFFDNIFVGVAGGVNIYFGEHDSYGKFGKRMAPALDVHVGKWFTPSVGARVGYSGLQAKGWTTAGTKYAKGADGSMFKEKFGVSYLHADAMWNFSNAVSGYKQTRTWNFVPFVGVGWARSYGNGTHDNEIGFDARLFRFGKLHPDPYVGFVGGVYANPAFFQVGEQVVRRPAGSGGCVRCGRCLCPEHAVKSVRGCQSPFVLLIPR